MTKKRKPGLTAEGLAFCWGCGVMIFWGGIRFDGFFLLLGFVGVGLIFWARRMVVRNLEGIVVERRQPREIFAGEGFRLDLSVRVEGRRGARRRIVLRDSLAPGTRGAEVAVGDLATGLGRKAGVPLRLFGRGERRGPFYELRSRFPLGLFEASRRESYRPGKSESLIVFPQPLLPVTLRANLDQTVLDSALAPRVAPDAMGELRGLREHRPGDPFKVIHWPSTARGRRLMVREWDPPQPKPLRLGLLFHSFESPGEIIRPERFERVVQVVSGFLRYCQELSIPVTLLMATGAKQETGRRDFLKMPDAVPFRRGYEGLAFVRRRGMREAAELAALAGEFSDCDHLFVIGDSPMQLWKRHVASEKRPVVCVDPDSVGVERRRLRVTRRKEGRT